MRGRKANPLIVPADVNFKEEAFDRLNAGAAELATLQTQQQQAARAVALQLGYQLPADSADPDLIQRDIAANMRRSVEACLEVGRGLRVLKEACGHGNFVARLDVLGIEVRVAQKFMAAASRFSKAASTPLLKAAGNQTKLFEMLVLDDEQIEELELTGQTGELRLDDVATMSVKELRAALREARAEAEATGEVLAKKNERIDRLEREKALIAKLPPDEELSRLHAESTSLMNDALGRIGGTFRQALIALADHAERQGEGGANAVFMAGLVGQLSSALAGLRQEFNLPDASEAVSAFDEAAGQAIREGLQAMRAAKAGAVQ